MDQRFYQTSQFAHKASVSVRTLRYYDKVGLLSPSQYTEAGYRLYTDADLLDLQQILALKFLGFSLDEIKACLDTGPKGLQRVLVVQKAMMQEKRTQLDTIIQAIEETEKLLQTGQCSWEAIVKVIQVMHMDQQKEWQDKYFTKEQRDKMQELSEMSYSDEAKRKMSAWGEWTEADQKKGDEQYAFVKNELTRLVAIGADPASPEAQKVAETRHKLISSFTQNDPDVESGLKKWWENFSDLPADQKPFDTSMYTYSKEENEFLDKALEIYKQNHP